MKILHIFDHSVPYFSGYTFRSGYILEHQRGLIALLAGSVNAADGNIEKIGMDERDGRISVVQLVVSVHDRVHLARVIKKLRTIKGVTRITRVKA